MYNQRLKIKRKAFTLIEILISTAIFAMVALIANVVVAQSMGYLTKLKVVRSTTSDAARVAESLSVDFRLAGEPITVSQTISGTTSSINFKNGFVTLNCNQVPVANRSIRGTIDGSFAYSSTDFENSTDTIFLLSKNTNGEYKYVIYKIYPTSEGRIRRAEKAFTDKTSFDNVSEICGIIANIMFISDKNNNNIADPDIDNLVTVVWDGYSKDADPSPDGQSYLNFIVNAKSPKYPTAREQEKSWTSIRSSITARSLNI